MIILFKGIDTENIVVFDAEYNEGFLIQFSAVMLQRVDKELYQISKSLNVYVQLPEEESVNYFIQDFTGITDNFLKENGESIEDALVKINKFFEVEGSVLVASHGIVNDRIVMYNNGLDYLETDGLETICTYKMAKDILKREKNLKLSDIANEAGYFLANKHNAFDDVIANIAVLSFLCKRKEEKKDEIKKI